MRPAPPRVLLNRSPFADSSRIGSRMRPSCQFTFTSKFDFSVGLKPKFDLIDVRLLSLLKNTPCSISRSPAT